MSTDTMFITNEENNKLVDRFNDLIKDTEYFDCLMALSKYGDRLIM
ncbi:MAG: hypothetical protein LBD03_09935 [Methanobrevibacter sp.]|jgi:hypothetical protein|nr:hypothetical protein [Candidatus Methanovirga procula]